MGEFVTTMTQQMQSNTGQEIQSGQATNNPSSKRDLLVWGLLVALMLLVTFMQLRFYDWPVSVDLKVYAVGAHEMIHGRELYTDIWDLKPPAVWVTFAVSEWLFGYGPQQFFALVVICNILLIVGIYRAALVTGMGPWAGLAGALIWSIQCTNINLELHNANTEYFINVLMVWAFVGMLRQVFGTQRLWVGIAIGFSLLLASLYKHSIVLGMVPLAIAYVWAMYNAGRFRHALRDALIFALIGLLGWGLVFTWFGMHGRMDDLYFTMVDFGRYYGGNVFANIWAKSNFSFWFDLLNYYRGFFFLLFLTALLIIELGKSSSNQKLVMFLGLLSFAYVSSFCLMDHFGHYFQYMVLALSLGAGWSLTSLWRNRQRIPRSVLIVVTGCLIYGIGATQWGTWTGTLEQYNQRDVVHKRMATGREVGKWIGKRLTADQFLFVWGFRMEPVFVSGVRISSGVMVPIPAVDGPFTERMTNMIRQNLQAHPPQMVLFCDAWAMDLPAVQDHVITHWIKANFTRLAESDDFPGFSLWVPKGAPQDLPPVPQSP
jgi:hypothetical protein